MPFLPETIVTLLAVFQGEFTKPTWKNIQTLIIGAILCNGKRTVSAILRVMGLKDEENFNCYHYVCIIMNSNADYYDSNGNYYARRTLIITTRTQIIICEHQLLYHRTALICKFTPLSFSHTHTALKNNYF
jgi:hypothetical protein